MPRNRTTAGNSRRRTPKQERGVATVDAILTAAAHILGDEGPTATTTNRIAEVAGVSIGSLYQYFPDKKTIFGRLLERERKRMASALAAALEQHRQEPIGRAIHEALRAALAVGRSQATFHQALFHDVPAMLGDPRSGTAARGAFEKDLTRFLEERRSEISVSDPKAAAFLIVQSVNALMHESSVRPDNAIDDDRLLHETSEMVSRYLGVTLTER